MKISIEIESISYKLININIIKNKLEKLLQE